MNDNEIRQGDYVKFRLTDGENIERVWGEVISVDVEKQTLKARIDNHPISPAWSFNDEIEFPVHFVLDKFVEETNNDNQDQDQDQD